MADRKISDLTALTTPATGDLIPIVDISEAAAADKNKSITVGELLRGAPDGTAAAPGIAFESDGGNGMFLGGTDILAFSTGGSQAVTIDASQRVGIGTSTFPSYAAADNLVINDSANAGITIRSGTTSLGTIAFSDATSGAGEYDGFVQYDQNGQSLTFGTASADRVKIDSSGRVGIGTTSPASKCEIDVGATSDYCLELDSENSGDQNYIKFAAGTTFVGDLTRPTGTNNVALNAQVGSTVFQTGGTERARIDSSGRLLVGTSSSNPNTNSRFQIADTSGNVTTTSYSANNNSAGYHYFFKNRGASIDSHTIVQNGDSIANFYFAGSDGTEYRGAASIEAVIDGTPGSSDMPGRLVFSTTADGASSPTERMRITNEGNHLFYSNGGTVLTFGSSRAASTADFLLVGTSGATGINTGTNRFFVFTNGNVQNTNNSYGAISDIKLKENIVNATSQWDDLKAIQVRNYNFKEGQTHTQIGVVAQEVELVSPGLVTESPDRDEEGNDLGTTTKSVNYSVLYMKAVKALQEAMERIETLEAKVAALEAN